MTSGQPFKGAGSDAQLSLPSAKSNQQTVLGMGNQQAGNNIYNNNYPIRSLSKLPSIIAKLVPAICKILDDQEVASLRTPYDISEKILHNNINKYIDIINDYGQYGQAIDSLYTAYDEEAPNTKAKIARFFTGIYYKVRDDFDKSDPLYGDKVLSASVRILEEMIDYSSVEVFQEEAFLIPAILVCHAFIECHILPAPPC